ncbi:MAG: glycosyltransferase family 39 protein, partial [Bryobacteraceae bacterium]
MEEPETSAETARRSPARPKGLCIAELAFLAALMAFVVVMCWPWMTHLGVYNDEAHFFPQAAKIAAGSPESEHFPSGLYLFHRPFPFMTAAFIGAFDAYLYGLVFAIFGITPLVYRVTNLVLGLLLVALAYGLARSLYGRLAAILTGVLLVSDVEFLLHAPTNFGPILVQMLCATVSVLLLWKWIGGGPQWHLFWAAFLLGLAFTEKLTFVLFLAGLLVSLACFYAKPILARLTVGSFLQACAAFGLGCLPVVIYTAGNLGVVSGFGRENTGSPAQWAAALAQRPAQFKSLLTGQFSLSVMSGLAPGVGRFSMLWAGFWFALACCVAGAILCRVRPSLRAWAPPRVVGFLLCLCAGIVISSAFFTESG